MAVRRVCASADQASSPLHVFQASNLGPLGCRASCTAPRALDSRAVLPNRFGEPREGAEGGTRTRTARRPLAPQGFVRLSRPSVLFPSVNALTGTISDAKASAQRPAKCRPSVANRRHLYSNGRRRICADVRPWCVGDYCQLREPHPSATGGVPRLAGRPATRQPSYSLFSVHLAGARDFHRSARSRRWRNRPSDAPDIESPVEEEPALRPRLDDQMEVGVNADEFEPPSVRH